MIQYSKQIKGAYYIAVIFIGIYAIRKTLNFNIKNGETETANGFKRFNGETDTRAILWSKVLLTMYIGVIILAMLTVRVDGLHE
jgi:hypothetical protein